MSTPRRVTVYAQAVGLDLDLAAVDGRGCTVCHHLQAALDHFVDIVEDRAWL